ncbi:MAG: DUF2062 domain-containing protein [Sphingobacterium sp.]|uniref:DUF2062 domain-containing protein n=1 Tax=Sphingobacterium sp. JB170 TaxID=1434842 RepID=UPI00097EB6C4|nr:DUF2062 domain-containing protein [Sphingobacterium sp. JB170]SJN44282.1 glycosyl transferase, family 2 [Sphingobacterium sp. JB170]
MNEHESIVRKSTPQCFIVIIPTYNNDKTLARVLDAVLRYSNAVLVVDDGSTDNTKHILKGYPQIQVISYSANRGKGFALRQGFQFARAQGFKYAFTIDSDGQHYPSDIPVFLARLETTTEPLLLIGSRNMNHASVPGKSSFGNRFSNFWFWFETGIKLTDTQSGFRAYPLEVLPRKFYTKKFEFEIEVIVRTAWNGIAVENVPIDVLYDSKERVSHFRPFRDFTRISILNCVLVLLTFVYILPRNFIRSFKKKTFTEFVRENILGTEDSPEKKALSIGLGVFLGIAPVWGFQTALTITLSVFFRLNKVLAFAFSNISFAPFIPVIIYASLLVGGAVYPSAASYQIDMVSLETIKSHLWQYLVGSVILASGAALFFGLSSYIFFKFYRQRTVSTR